MAFPGLFAFGRITRRPVLFAAGLTVLLAAAIGGYAWRHSTPRRNLILITLDTTRADRLGCYGHPAAKTPAMDRLAERGVLFERAYAPVPLTLPSHATILTGLYPPEHGLRVNGQGALPAGIPTLTTGMNDAGYETGAFIAAPIVLERKYGLAEGFDAYDDDQTGSIAGLQGHYGYRPANVVVEAALRWLQPRSRQRFFCWIHLYDPHYPYLTHEDEFGEQFVGEPYDAEIAFVDRQIQRILDSLDRWGVAEQTAIAVVADHGESLHEHGERTHGMTVYEPALRVPMIISIPRGCRAGHRVAEPVSLVDVCPTLLQSLGLPAIRSVSGRSLTGALRGEPLSPVACYAESDEPYQEARCASLRALITADKKFIRSPIAEFYDLKEDPGELRNLAADQPELARRMDEELRAWEERMQRRSAVDLALTSQERRTLSSLGYASRSDPAPDDTAGLPDVKELLPLFNKLNDADALIESGQAGAAESILREILAAHADYSKAHDRLGRCLLQLNRPQEAIAAFRRSLDLAPEVDRVRTTLGAALYVIEDYSAAAIEFERALRGSGDLIEARYNYGLALEKLGRRTEAIKQYEQCLDHTPHFLPARQRLQELTTVD